MYYLLLNADVSYYKTKNPKISLPRLSLLYQNLSCLRSGVDYSRFIGDDTAFKTA